MRLLRRQGVTRVGTKGPAKRTREDTGVGSCEKGEAETPFPRDGCRPRLHASPMRVRLVPCPPPVRALVADPSALAAHLGVSVPDGWPTFPEAFDPAFPFDPDWPGVLFVDDEAASLVGNGGFAGPPTAGGEVEIGYEVAPAFQGRGYATEALRLLLGRAFADASVVRVVAHTLAEENASNAVLKKAGFTFAGEVASDEVGSVWRWEKARDAA